MYPRLISAKSWFFVLLVGLLGRCAAAEKPAQQYREHHDLSYYLLPDGTRVTIRTPDDWQRRRQHIIAGMEQVMGPLPRPSQPVPLDVQILEEQLVDGLVRRKVAYHTDRLDQRVSAWLLLPSAESSQRRPAVLCLHQTTPGGKASPVGLSDRPTLHYALELARRGYVTISPDYPSFGDYPYDFDADDYESGSMKAIYDNIRTIDLLQSLPQVDPERIGCIGHSLGGHNGLFTAVFDQRLKAIVTSCGFTSFHRYYGGDLRGWSSKRYMPRVATHYNFSPDQMPFDFPEVLASLAPRAVFVVAPQHDDNFAVEGVRECVAAAKPIYTLLGAANHLRVIYPDAPHDFPDDSRHRAYEFLDKHLQATK